MKRSVGKKPDDSFELKMSSCPVVNGMNSYSVFKNDRLIFMKDGDRASVFKPVEAEVIGVVDDEDVGGMNVTMGTVDFDLPFGRRPFVPPSGPSS